MNNADVERALAAWMLEEGPDREPPGLLERVVSISARRGPRPAAIARLIGTHVEVTTSHPGILHQRKEQTA